MNKVIGENEDCALFYRKNCTDFLANPIYVNDWIFHNLEVLQIYHLLGLNANIF